MKALFRMSRTAGVGLQDYAEVNVLAVVGLILGLASFLAYAASDSLAVLIVPAVAVVVCLLAATQVLGSNRTQTGLPLAIVGLLLALGFASSNLAAHVATTARETRYHAELNAVVAKLRVADATTQSADAAYDLFDARFQEAVQPATFARVLRQRMTATFAGKPVTSVTVGDLVVYESDGTGTTATTLLVLHADGTFPDGSPMQASDTIDFKQTDAGGWRIHSIPNWFGEAKRPTVAPQ